MSKSDYWVWSEGEGVFEDDPKKVGWHYHEHSPHQAAESYIASGEYGKEGTQEVWVWGDVLQQTMVFNVTSKKYFKHKATGLDDY